MPPDLTPKEAKIIYAGVGGAYSEWCPTDLPMLSEGKLGAAKLSLKKNGFARPRYSDSAKIAYVLQGSGVGGVTVPEKKEKVVAIKKGDAIAIPRDVGTWWYNKEETDLVLLFLGNTIEAKKPGCFTDFFCDSMEEVSQKEYGIVKEDPRREVAEEDYDGMAVNCVELVASASVSVSMASLNSKKLPLLGQVGLGANLVRLRSRVKAHPGYCCDEAVVVTYITRGSGHIQIKGVDPGDRPLVDTDVKPGDLYVIPRWHIVTVVAGYQGIEFFSLVTTSH